MTVRKAAASLFASGALIAGSLLGLANPASAAPRLSCAYTYVCGQAANGSSFAYTQCNTLYQLPDLVGSGPLVNNQTPGTTAYFYDKNQNFLFSSTAYETKSVDWTPVWYAIAC